jgi:streptomycin 6-kinase
MFLQHDTPATTTRVDSLGRPARLERQRTRAWLFALATQAASWHLFIGDSPTHEADSRAVSKLL